MPPNLSSVFAQGWRSTGSRRNISTSSLIGKLPMSTGETVDQYIRNRVLALIVGYSLGHVYHKHVKDVPWEEIKAKSISFLSGNFMESEESAEQG